MKSELFGQLINQFEGELRSDDLSKAIYSTDASVYQMTPKGVAIPSNEDDLVKLISWSADCKIPLIPRAAGTSLAGQCVGDGVVVDTSKYLNRIIAFDKEKRLITVEPGVIRDELNQFLQPHGLFFGPNTSTANRCMIGGMVGNNSSGTTSIRYGVTRDKVVGLRSILSDGSIHEFGELLKEPNTPCEKITSEFGQQIENQIIGLLSEKDVKEEVEKEFPKKEIHRRNTGYAVDELLEMIPFGGSEPFNLAKLLCGSEGTLAFTSQITLALDDAMPMTSAMVVTHYQTLEEALSDVAVVMQEELFTCEMMDRVILDCTKGNHTYREMRSFIEGDPEAVLMLEVRDQTEEGLEQKLASLLNLIESKSKSYANPVLRGSRISDANQLRKAGLGLLGNIVGDKKAVACIEDTAVALSDLKHFIMEFSEIMKGYDQKAVYYAHAGAGELHLRPILNLKDQSDVVLFRAITTDVAHLTKKYRGSFSGEHGDGIVRAEFIPFLIGDKNYDLLRKVKAVFDPNNLFNPHKIVDPFPMDRSLRFEPGRTEPEIETLFDFEDSLGYLRAVERCNGSGDCRKTEKSSGGMCPSYHATREEKDTTRARANALRIALTENKKEKVFASEDAIEVLDLCVSCKACASECPSNVDMATLKSEYLYQYQEQKGYKLRSKLFAYSTLINRLSSRIAPITRLIFTSPFANVIKSLSGIAKQRQLPLVYNVDFKKYLAKLQNNQPVKQEAKRLVLYIDEFSQYMDVTIAKSAINTLHRLGYNIELVFGESGRAFISKGFLKQAKKAAEEMTNRLASFIEEEVVIVGIEPSAILTFRDEYQRLLPNHPLVQKLKNKTFLIEEFLAKAFENQSLDNSIFLKESAEVKVHVHCHQKALSNTKVTFDLLNQIPNYKVSIINSGCCGMAGSFGYEAEHYEVSMKMGGLRLFKSIQKSDEKIIVVANGTSCRHQIKDGTSRDAIHPIQVIEKALV
jgi:FAD/FMN-containing dehydrogenase/Fe-S oxidoreductase